MPRPDPIASPRLSLLRKFRRIMRLLAGFSIVIAALLWLTYLVFLKIPGKSAYSILSCTVLLGALVALQLGHLLHFTGGPVPLATIAYRIALFVGKEMVERDVPVAEADERLVALIKRYGRWIDPVPVGSAGG